MSPLPLIERVLADLADAAPKLVYADWLDEHGFPGRAGFVRYLGRTGRWPGPGVARRGLAFAPAGSLSPAQHCLPVVFCPWLFEKSAADGTYYGRTFYGPADYSDWVELEKAGARAWTFLVTDPPRRLGLFPRRPWVPDDTPVLPQDGNDEWLMRWAAGER